jgi:hypothetical protein
LSGSGEVVAHGVDGRPWIGGASRLQSTRDDRLGFDLDALGMMNRSLA